MFVLDFAQSNYGRSRRALGSSHFCAQFADDLCHIAELRLILLFCPLVGTRGQKLVVVLTRIMGGVKQVFHIVESHSIEHLLLCCGAELPCKDEDKKSQYKLLHCEVKG